MVQASQPLDVDRGIDLTVVVNIGLDGVNHTDWMPLGVDHGCLLGQYTTEHTLTHNLVVVKINLLSCEIMVHLETLVAIRLFKPISIALVVEQQVYRQYMLLEYFLELVIQDKGEELIVFNASVKVL